jgi:hypothetical protein
MKSKNSLFLISIFSLFLFCLFLNIVKAQIPSTPPDSTIMELDNILKSLDEITGEINSIPIVNVPVTANPCITLTRIFGAGDTDVSTGGQVSMLQRFLREQGYSSVVINGSFGLAADDALRDFQIKNGLIPKDYSGRIETDKATQEKIKNISCGIDATNTFINSNQTNPNDKASVKISFENPSHMTGLGTVQFGGEAFSKLKVNVVSGKPTFKSLKGLEGSIGYAGGEFPGEGGTCSSELVNGCTIALSFKPVTKDGTKTLEGRMVYKYPVSLVFTDSTGEKTSNEITVGGYSPRLTEISPIIFREERKYLPTFLKNDDASIKISFTVLTANELKEVRLLQASLPFSSKGVSCKEAKTTSVINMKLYDCFIIYTMDTRSAGEFTTKVGINMFDGEKIIDNYATLKAGVINGSEYNLEASRNLLIVYNSESSDSKNILDYYIANRPGFKNANVLPLSYPNPNEEIATLPLYKKNIEKPIEDWINSHPEKDIRHIVLVRGFPTRVYFTDPPTPRVSTTKANTTSIQSLIQEKELGTDCENPSYGYPTDSIIIPMVAKSLCITPSDTKIGFYTKARYPGSLALVTLLDMGSTEATLRYIDKLKNVYDNMSNPSIFISASNASVGGSTYYIEDHNSVAGNTGTGLDIVNKLKDFNQNTPIQYVGYGGSLLPDTLSDVKGFFTWGGNGPRGGTYPVDGKLKFTGNSNWYVIETAESFNGWRDMTWQGSYVKWFSKNAFGGENYDKTPVGAVAHADEPNLLGINSTSYFPCWDQGNLFIDCAWYSRRSGNMMAIGDPWVRK